VFVPVSQTGFVPPHCASVVHVFWQPVSSHANGTHDVVFAVSQTPLPSHVDGNE